MARQKQDGSIPVVADVSYKRLKKKIYLKVDVQSAARWDAKRQNIRSPKGIEKLQFQHLEAEKARLNELFVLAKMANIPEHEMLRRLKNDDGRKKNISHYFDVLIKAAKSRGAESMVRLFRVGKSVWLDVIPDLPAQEISKIHVAEFVSRCIAKKTSSNSISQYANLMLAALKEAKEDGCDVNLDIFKNQLPKVVKTKRAAYTDAELQAFYQTKLEGPALVATMYVKCALFSCGCDISDLLRIPKEQYLRGAVNYQRNKTGVPIKFTVHPWVKDFILNDALYLEVQEKQASRLVMRRVMRVLLNGIKEAGEVCGVENALLKRARHTWATIAKKKGVSKDVIAEALGHKGGMMTDVYLGAYDLEHVDAANAVVINHFHSTILTFPL